MMSRIVTKVTLALPLAALCLGAVAALAAPVVPGVRGQASKRFAAPPLIVTVKTMSAEIVQGEPLTVKYEIANAADGAIAASKRIQGADWLDVRLVRADGSEIQALPPLRFDNPKRSQTKFIVFGGSPYEGYRVAGRWSKAVAPGSYQVWVRAGCPTTRPTAQKKRTATK